MYVGYKKLLDEKGNWAVSDDRVHFGVYGDGDLCGSIGCVSYSLPEILGKGDH